MPVVEYVAAIHTTVKKFLNYIVNGDKTEKGAMVIGLNVSTDTGEAYDALKYNYVYFSKNREFDNQKINYIRNEKGHLVEHGKVTMHHYVQSFDPKEKITPEEANAIGVEWAKKVFGDEWQIIVSTHVDKEHIHNHFAVCPYSLSGKKWNSNQKTLNYCRKVSDKIAKEHGLSIIENPKSKNNGKRKEWEARQSGTSWKKNLCDKIDDIILKDSVNSLEDIQRELQKEGYYVRLGKYMTIKPPDQQRSIRTENLDRVYGGYSMRELEYRIKHKNKEISFSTISRMTGIEKSYAVYLRSLQITVFKTNGKQYKDKTYRELVKDSDLLTYITLNNIQSQDDLRRLSEKRKDEYKEIKEAKRSMEKRIKHLSEHDYGDDSKRQIAELQMELDVLNNSIEEAEKNLNEANRFYQQYCDEYETDDYTKAVEEYNKLYKLLEEDAENNNDRDSQNTYYYKSQEESR